MESNLGPKSLTTMEISRVLRRLMAEHDLKIAQLARQTKVPVQTLHNWLGGQKPRDLDQVQKVARHFKVSIDYLVFGTDSKAEIIEQFKDEINAGIFEVILRRIRK